MKAHRTDKVSLTFAVIFLMVAAWWLLARLYDLTLPAVGWFVAGGLIIFGLLGLLGALRAARSEPAAPVDSVPPATSAPPADTAELTAATSGPPSPATSDPTTDTWRDEV
jgi:hypothetical protein